MKADQSNSKPLSSQPVLGGKPKMNRSRSSYDVDQPLPMGDQILSLEMKRFSPLADSLRSILEEDAQVLLRDTKAVIVEDLPDEKSLDTATDNATIKDFKSSNGVQETKKDADDRLTFTQSTTLFNSAAPLAAWIVVRPKSAEDVIKTIQFCKQNYLSPSIRSGGYSTAGWSIQGDVVLDMRSMNNIRILPPSERNNPNYRLYEKKGKGSNSNNKNNSSSSSSEEDARVYQQSSSKQNKGRSADAGEDENGIGRSDVNKNGTFKRRKGNEIGLEQDSRMESPVQEADSGAEGDAETSSGSKGGSSGRSTSDHENDTILKDSTLVGNSPQEHNGMARILSSSGNGTPQSHSTSSGEPSHSSSMTNDENNGATTTTTSVTSPDVDMSDNVKSNSLDAEIITEQQGKDESFEHLRWKRHHRPPMDRSQNQSATSSNSSYAQSTSDKRLVLPTSGGFIWTAGDSSQGTSSMGTTRPFNPSDPVYLGGSTLPDLRAAQSYMDGTNDDRSRGENGFTASHSGATPGLYGITLNDTDNITNGVQPTVSPNSEHYLKPGIHSDKFILVEFQPGVGVRDLDVYTDRIGREGLPKEAKIPSSPLADEKGKHKSQDVYQSNLDQSGLSFTLEDGIPYHVPLSAYPVGSTAMTIGGFGYLSRAYGLSLDNIVELDIVLADGRLKTLNASSAESKDEEDRDLWWAVRGAAPCFGIVTRMIAKAYPVPKVFAGNLIYPFNPATAPSLLRHWRDCLKGTGESIPRELYSNLILTAGPPDAKAEHVIVIQICYLGTGSSEEIGHNFLQAINSWTGERVLLKDVSEKSMLTQQDGVAKVLKSGQGRRWMVRGDLLKTLTDEVISKSVEQFRLMANGAVWLFELIGGAIEDEIENNSTCVGEKQRKAKFTAGALQQWNDQNEDEQCVKGVESWVNEVLAPVSVGGPFAAFLERGETRERCEGAFGKENFERLLEIKKKLDPNGMFCHSFGRGLCEFVKD